MTRNEVVEIIVNESIGREGFLLKLREREFSENQFKELMLALREFKRENQSKNTIEKEIVISLYYLDLYLRWALDVFVRSEEEKELVMKSQLECSELILEIITPETMPDYV